MVQECRITLKQGSKSPADWLLMEFNDGKNIHVYTKDRKLILKSQLLPSDETMMIKISPQNPYFGIKYDDNVLIKGESETYRELARLVQYNQNVQTVDRIDHNGVHVYSDKGNPNLTTHKFDFINQTAIATSNFVTLKNHYRAAAIVKGMNKEQKKDVMYHFGHDPKDMTHSQLFMRLIDPGNGIVLNRARFDDKIVNGQTIGRSYLEYFVDRYSEANEDITIQTLVSKALLIKLSDGRNIIEKRANGYYYINENSIGQNFHEAAEYLKRNKKDFDYVKNNVEKNDVLVEDDIPSLLLAKGIKETDDGVEEQNKEELKNNESFQKRERLLNVCREKYRMTVNDEMSIAKLETLIKEAQSTWSRLNFFSELKKEIESHQEWSYERYRQMLDDAEIKRKEEKQLQKKNKFAVA